MTITSINNEAEFKSVLKGLNDIQQREVAAQFVENVLSLSTDERVERVLKVASDADANADELAAALKSARAATFDTHTRCGAEGDWKEQAGYFVARAATAAVTPGDQSKSGGPAWQAAMSCRMARTSIVIDAEDTSAADENEQQYRILSDFLGAQ
jgi:hypothetical protein